MNLPPEIIEVIISYVQHALSLDYSPDLESCSLTCRALVRPSQARLFYKIELLMDHEPLQLLRILSSSPHLGKYIVKLRLSGSAVPPQSVDAQWPWMSLFGAMSSITNLHLCNFRGHEPLTQLKPILEDSILRRVQHLYITDAIWLPIWLVSCCTQLKAIHVSDASFTVNRGDPNPKRCDPLPLEKIELGMISAYGALFDVLLRSGTKVVSFEVVKGGGITKKSAAELSMFTHLFQLMRGTLVHLDIDYWGKAYAAYKQPSTHPFFIGHFPHLRCFHMRIEQSRARSTVLLDRLYRHFATQITWLAGTLRAINTTHPLHRIEIGISHYAALVEPPAEALEDTLCIVTAWHELDEALDRSSVLPQLKTVTIKPWYKPGPAYTAPQLLPAIHKRGLLVNNLYVYRRPGKGNRTIWGNDLPQHSCD
ncbi:hypothetical protein DL96DRAFT_1681060 [Flagelloscypha sp. PMI_526]|nr:hypothetical protein DL96DRAFT_1681060 [Flagelloscypha sp. PMI_526]